VHILDDKVRDIVERVEHPFVLLNVFAVPGRTLSGNPLCVFERAEPFDDATMQSLARQFNLSETTFVLPPSEKGATKRVRIFTPSFEMPFAGHPTLGTAHVVRRLVGIGDRLMLEMKAGLVEVIAHGDEWTLRAARAPEVRKPDASRAQLAAMLGLNEHSMAEHPLWVDTGAEQLVLPLTSPAEVVAARPNAELLAKHGFTEKRGASMAYIWAETGDGEILARFFFVSGGGVVEDPATGSACANLGGWMIATRKPLPAIFRISQGEAVDRPSLLRLHVDEDRHIFVSGLVEELGRGTIKL
jgi:PhzF family phenazine biosynthesis protein